MIIINTKLLVRYLEGHKPPRSSGSFKQDTDIMKNTNKCAGDTTSFMFASFSMVLYMDAELARFSVNVLN